MTKIKILNKRPNWKQKKLLADLEPIIEKRMLTDPEFARTFKPVDPSDLEKLHSAYFTEDAKIISETKTETTPRMENNTTNTDTSNFVDPINRQEPIIRDYVKKGDQFSQQTEQIEPNVQTSFNEPTTFGDAFTIPDTDEKDNVKGASEKKETTSQFSSSQNSGSGSGSGEQKQSQPKQQPVNPSFDNMDNASKKRKTRKMAKHIVKAVCFMLEKGFVWWTTKDINETVLVAAELRGEIDLRLMISLDENQQVTIKEFFRQACSAAMEQAKISEDDQQDLEEDLFDVLMEKGIAPTPMQSLMISFGQVLLSKGIAAFFSQAQTKAVLVSARETTAQMKADYDADEAAAAEAMANANTKDENNDEVLGSNNATGNITEAQIIS